MSRRTVLTGITTTGTPHLGNYVGAIKPAIEASHGGDVRSCYFLADYHALIKCREPEVVHRSTLEIAATWMALGLSVVYLAVTCGIWYQVNPARNKATTS